MWNIWTKWALKENRSSSRAIVAAALIASFFMSLLCTLFYNMWVDQNNQIMETTGAWQVQIHKELSADDLKFLENYAGISSVVNNRTSMELSNGQSEADLSDRINPQDSAPASPASQSQDSMDSTDLYFSNIRKTYSTMPGIAEGLNLQPDEYVYNEVLLSQYLIFNPNNPNPPLLLSFYLLLLVISCISLILVLKNSFELSMRQRIQQLGLLASVGASPAQIRQALFQEAFALTLLPVLAGTALGVLGAWILIQFMLTIASAVQMTHQFTFVCSPWVVLGCLLMLFAATAIAILIPAGKLARISVLDAFRYSNVPTLKKEKKVRLYAKIFGVEGEIAGYALKAQKKALRTGTFAVTLGFLAFSISLSFLALSDISTSHTYFERYADNWDVMLEVRNTGLEQLEGLQEIRTLPDLTQATAYQLENFQAAIPADSQSSALKEQGGLEVFNKAKISDEMFRMNVAAIVMDDQSFGDFLAAKEVKKADEVDKAKNGAILINSFWDSKNSPSLDKAYIPLLNPDTDTILVARNVDEQNIQQDQIFLPAEQSGLAEQSAQTAQSLTSADSVQNQEPDNDAAENSQSPVIRIPIIGFSQEMPRLREPLAFQDVNLVISESMFEQMNAVMQLPEDSAKTETSVRLLSTDSQNLEVLNELGQSALNILQKANPSSEISEENRIQAKIDNDQIFSMYRMVIGFFCAILGIIGLSTIFFHTISFLRMRQREFAQYISLGMSEKQMNKVFKIEALTISLKPVLIVVPLSVVISIWLADLSYVPQSEFWAKAPVIPILVYALAIIAVTLLAYWMGSKYIKSMDLTTTLRNDSF